MGAIIGGIVGLLIGAVVVVGFVAFVYLIIVAEEFHH